MDLLLKGVTIIHNTSPFHDKSVDIHLKDGLIHEIGFGLEAPNAVLIHELGLCCSIGWFDLTAQMGEPGFEHRETKESFMQAASYGGFTEVAVLPNLVPITQTRSSVYSVKSYSQNSPVTIHPIGAVTENCEGQDLSELVDMHRAGAVAFSDGVHAIQASDSILKALEYLSLIDGLLLNRAENLRMALGGQMHEGVISTTLGLKGIPSIAEETQVVRDLQLLEYAGGRLHFSQVSSAKSIEAIRTAKKKGLAVTCDVASYQCAFTDNSIVPFDTNYKVSPPFRSEEDRKAIVDGLSDGTIDVLVSSHLPLEIEAKELEFDFAQPGIVNIQTAFSIANQTLRPHLALSDIVHKLTVRPREVLMMEVPTLEEGSIANLTLFHPEREWSFTLATNASLSINSPFLGQSMKGSVYGTFHQNILTKNPTY
ncbi:dihydroorotase [Rufibacter sp. DG15C]|nr:dihydroorotase [Rufibacter sp. DG15C]